MNGERLFNQNEAADYYREVYGAEIHPQHISILNRYNHGPDHTHKGNMKLFTKGALDAWASQQGWAQLDAA